MSRGGGDLGRAAVGEAARQAGVQAMGLVGLGHGSLSGSRRANPHGAAGQARSPPTRTGRGGPAGPSKGHDTEPRDVAGRCRRAAGRGAGGGAGLCAGHRAQRRHQLLRLHLEPPPSPKVYVPEMGPTGPALRFPDRIEAPRAKRYNSRPATVPAPTAPYAGRIQVPDQVRRRDLAGPHQALQPLRRALWRRAGLQPRLRVRQLRLMAPDWPRRRQGGACADRDRQMRTVAIWAYQLRDGGWRPSPDPPKAERKAKRTELVVRERGEY